MKLRSDSFADARLAVEGRFGGADVRDAVAGHVLARAGISGVYTLNPRLA